MNPHLACCRRGEALRSSRPRRQYDVVRGPLPTLRNDKHSCRGLVRNCRTPTFPLSPSSACFPGTVTPQSDPRKPRVSGTQGHKALRSNIRGSATTDSAYLACNPQSPGPSRGQPAWCWEAACVRALAASASPRRRPWSRRGSAGVCQGLASPASWNLGGARAGATCGLPVLRRSRTGYFRARAEYHRTHGLGIKPCVPNTTRLYRGDGKQSTRPRARAEYYRTWMQNTRVCVQNTS
ncbi:hypothetical protein NDU88_008201 [Pleurodeles waltl]|uniref:Uncharacterized protein n=1 Tax=Pleurodeles waltl TaxID=8319 RepID=A0AAV7QTV5_PLEWA|nr:hypothetical protein NDU88_008201 [Pleurodeles waltl]